jgi:hypothetical protein
MSPFFFDFRAVIVLIADGVKIKAQPGANNPLEVPVRMNMASGAQQEVIFTIDFRTLNNRRLMPHASASHSKF